MADSAVDKSETVAVVEKEVEKPVSTEDIADEDSKQSENGESEIKKENGVKVTTEEDEESKDGENGSTESTEAHDACTIKRKSGGGDAPEGTPVEGASPEKKAKLDSADSNVEDNGVEAKVAA